MSRNLLRLTIFPYLAVIKCLATPVTNYYTDEYRATVPYGTLEFWKALFFSAVLLCIGGLMAGLTLGLLSQDETYLEVLKNSDDLKIRQQAHTVSNLIKDKRHWLLITLLLANTVVNEALPMLLDRVVGSDLKAVLVATILILIFGEIVPQAVCVRYGLAIGAYMAVFVRMLMYLLFPIAYPASICLDLVLGETQGTRYHKTDLKNLVRIHHAEDAGSLLADEVNIINSVLDLQGKSVYGAMTPIEGVYTLREDRVLDEATTDEILLAGFSRIPIKSKRNDSFVGILIVKRLISYDPKKEWPVSKFRLQKAPEMSDNMNCLDILNYFQEGKSHLALVTDESKEGMARYIGIITLEDVMEELIGEEIIDETDFNEKGSDFFSDSGDDAEPLLGS